MKRAWFTLLGAACCFAGCYSPPRHSAAEWREILSNQIEGHKEALVGCYEKSVTDHSRAQIILHVHRASVREFTVEVMGIKSGTKENGELQRCVAREFQSLTGPFDKPLDGQWRVMFEPNAIPVINVAGGSEP